MYLSILLYGFEGVVHLKDDQKFCKLHRNYISVNGSGEMNHEIHIDTIYWFILIDFIVFPIIIIMYCQFIRVWSFTKKRCPDLQHNNCITKARHKYRTYYIESVFGGGTYVKLDCHNLCKMYLLHYKYMVCKYIKIGQIHK